MLGRHGGGEDKGVCNLNMLEIYKSIFKKIIGPPSQYTEDNGEHVWTLIESKGQIK